jgi:hypothetical protein
LLADHEYCIYKSYFGTNALSQVIESTGVLHQNKHLLNLPKHANVTFTFFFVFGHFLMNKNEYKCDIPLWVKLKTKKKN